MNLEDAKKFFKSLGVGEFNESTLPYLTVPCPLAPWRHQGGTDSNPSFGFKIDDTGESRCHCLSCNYAGTGTELVMELKAQTKGMFTKQSGFKYDFKTAVKILDNEEEGGTTLALSSYDPSKPSSEMYEFPEWWVGSYPEAFKVAEAREYLLSRGVSKETAALMGFRWDSDQRRVCTPVRDTKGRVYGFHGRTIDKGVEPTYRMYTFDGKNNPEVWLGEHWLDFDEPVLIVESMFDLAAVLPLYKNSVCPLTASLMVSKIKRLKDGVFFVTLMDGDKAGIAARKKIEKNLPKASFEHVNMPDGKDPGDLSEYALVKLLDTKVKIKESTY